MPKPYNCLSNAEPNQREVELRIIFLRIGEIDTLNEKFFAEILVECKWQDEKLCAEFDQRLVREEKELSMSASAKYWNPKIYIENGLNDPIQTIHYKIKKEVVSESTRKRTTSECESRSIISNDQTQPQQFNDFNNVQFKYWNYEYRKLKGFFFEKLELEYFPVDIQSMSIVVTSYRSNREVRLVPNKKRKSIVNSKVNIDNNIWQLYQHVDVIDDVDDELDENEEEEDENDNFEFEKDIELKKKKSDEMKSSTVRFPMMRFECKAARRSGYFFWNAFLPIFFITSAVFTIFIIEPDKPQFRLPVTATLLLTSIMFKSSYSMKYLPTVNYLTSLDTYSICSLVFIYLCLIWHGTVSSLLSVYSNQIVFIIDRTVFSILLFTYFIVHVVLSMWLRSAYLIRNSMADKDEEFWRDQKMGGGSGGKVDDDVVQSFLANNSHHLSSPSHSVMQHLDTQKLNNPSGGNGNANGNGNFQRVSLKRESVFGTINNIDKINYYQNRRKSTIADNFRFFFMDKSKKSSNQSSGNSLNRVNPDA